MTNEEILKNAKNAKSPEELYKLARECGMDNFSEEDAKSYFDTLHKSGELSDDETDAAGGGCAVRENGKKMVAICNDCDHWRCEKCNNARGAISSFGLKARKIYADEYSLKNNCGHGTGCGNCYYCSYENGFWWCNNKPHYSE